MLYPLSYGGQFARILAFSGPRLNRARVNNARCYSKNMTVEVSSAVHSVVSHRITHELPTISISRPGTNFNKVARRLRGEHSR